MALLEIENLSVEFPSHQGVMHAVEGVSLTVDSGEVLGIVGESGSGKSVTMMALMGLVAYPGRIKADRLRFDGHDLLALSERDRRRWPGKDWARIFQDPTTASTPALPSDFSLPKHSNCILDWIAALRASAPLNCWSRWAFPHRRVVWVSIPINCQAV